MPEYKFYFVGKSGHIDGPARAYGLRSDHDAIKKAKLLVDGHDVEIWQGARMIAYIVPENDQAGLNGNRGWK